jgi:hypothetical protein
VWHFSNYVHWNLVKDWRGLRGTDARTCWSLPFLGGDRPQQKQQKEIGAEVPCIQSLAVVGYH